MSRLQVTGYRLQVSPIGLAIRCTLSAVRYQMEFAPC